MGWLPMHASSVVLVQNLMTGNLSPQFHVVFDPWFETVHDNGTVPPGAWDVMMSSHHHEVEVETDEKNDVAVHLQDDWLTKEELAERRHAEQSDIRSKMTKPTVKQEGEST